MNVHLSEAVLQWLGTAFVEVEEIRLAESKKQCTKG
jgi:hypothetical protein